MMQTFVYCQLDIVIYCLLSDPMLFSFPQSDSGWQFNLRPNISYMKMHSLLNLKVGFYALRIEKNLLFEVFALILYLLREIWNQPPVLIIFCRWNYACQRAPTCYCCSNICSWFPGFSRFLFNLFFLHIERILLYFTKMKCLICPGPRRFLFRHTFGRFQSEEVNNYQFSEVQIQVDVYFVWYVSICFNFFKPWAHE